MKKQLVVAALVLNALSVAHASEQDAYAGVAADAASTAASLAVPGIAETNPLGWATLPIRLAVIEHAKTLPKEEGKPIMDAVSASGWGAAANNLLVLAGAGPAAPVVGIALGYAMWKQGETEREFWRMCAVHKRFDPQVKCDFKPWKAEELVRIAQAQQDAQRLAVNVAQAGVARPH
jgi:hypothetical protein